MSDYFAGVRGDLAGAVARRKHLPWYTRVKFQHGRAVAVVVAALVIATPAVAAVSGWFSVGKPNPTPRVPKNDIFGVVKPGGSRLLPIRVADPQGGPAWGLRLVRTDRGNTCVQLGRVEDDQLGSLGIDDAWENDHEFHALGPNAAYADTCGTTDAAGYGYLSVDVLGEPASANPSYDTTRVPGSEGCKLRGVGGARFLPYCPAGSNRMIFYGLLGPDATSITYRKPDGMLAIERTVGGVGAYLIVFTHDQAASKAYCQSATESSSCDGGRGSGGPSPDQLGAVTKITYRDGHSCSVDPPAKLLAAYIAFNKRVRALPLLATQRQRYAQYARLWSAFLHHEHLTNEQFDHDLQARCPAVGWVSAKTTVTQADVASPITLHVFPIGTYACPKNPLHLPDGCNYPNVRHGVMLPPKRVIPVEWSFEARRAVTTTSTGYAVMLSYPKGCNAGGEGFGTGRKILAGQTLSYSTFINPKCRGTYKLVVDYIPQASPQQSFGVGVFALMGHAGSLLVGRTSFTIR
jgi:hypothetical protein